LKISKAVNQKTYNYYTHVNFWYLIILCLLLVWTVLFTGIIVYPSIKELISPNPFSNFELNTQSFDNFDQANTLAQRLVNDINAKLTRMKTLSESADTLISNKMNDFTVVDKAVGDENNLLLLEFFSIEGKVNSATNLLDNSFSPINNFITLVNDLKSNSISTLKAKDSPVESAIEDDNTDVRSLITSRIKSNSTTRYGLMKSQVEG